MNSAFIKRSIFFNLYTFSVAYNSSLCIIFKFLVEKLMPYIFNVIIFVVYRYFDTSCLPMKNSRKNIHKSMCNIFKAGGRSIKM